MTQSVSFHFTSSQFVLESGMVVFTKGARLFSDGEFQVGKIKDGCIDGVLVEGPIEFDAMLGDITIARIDDNRRYRVQLLKVTGDLRPEDLHAGRVVVHLNLPVVLIVKVEDPAGNAVPDAGVSLQLPHWEPTIEAQTDAGGEIVLLAGAGRYSATIASLPNRRFRPNVSIDVSIAPSDAGERTLILRAPSTS